MLSTAQLFAQVDFCKYRSEGDCVNDKYVKVSSRLLDDFLFDRSSMGDTNLYRVWIYQDLEKSKNADLLANYPLRELIFRKTKLEEVPAWLFGIYSLEKLDLGDNYLTSIPSQICQLIQLRDLILWLNDLHNLPFCVNEMVSLKRVDMTGIKLNEDDQRNLRNSFRAVDFTFSEPCMCNFGPEE